MDVIISLVGWMDLWWCLFGLLMFIMSSCFHPFVVGWMFVYMFVICQAYRCLKATIAVCWCLASTWPTTIQGHTTIPPHDVSPFTWRFGRQVSGHWTNAYHLGGLQFFEKNLRNIWNQTRNHGILFNGDCRMVMLPWSPPSTMTKVTRWTLETTVFFVGWKVEGKLCWKSVLLFFQTPCVFKLRVIAFAHFVDESFDVRAISDRYASSTREPNLDIQASEKAEVFLYRWKTDVASHDATTLVAWWIQGESSLTSLVCSLA